MILLDQVVDRSPHYQGLSADHPQWTGPGKAPWRMTIWARMLAFIVIAGVALSLIISVMVALRGDVSLPSWQMSLAQLIAIVLAYLLVVMAMEGRLDPLEVQPRRLIGLIAGCLVGLVALSLAVGVIAAAGGYHINGWNSQAAVWPTIWSAGVVAAITEELIMRGMLLRLLEEWLGSWAALAISALIFGALHLNNRDATLAGAIAIAVEAGLLFAAVYLLSRSLWCCIGLHAAWNIAEGPLFGSAISGTGRPPSLFEATWSGPDWLTGGAFGLEASAPAVLVCTGLAAALLILAAGRHRLVAPIWRRQRG
ncbi:MAG: CPBP family intramembrane metalloprotease [Propionibacteriaceae bacterium]|jgi:membrane protease YdiL (CAAX protease family)|nr:CPBP family intramembrane metalloprotease [Propionibacteriaceae bacterium]